MRRSTRVLSALLAASLAGSACNSSARPPALESETAALPRAGAAAVPSSSAAPPPAPAAPPRLVFRVSARQPATLLYALDRAASLRAPDYRYRKWLFEDPALPRGWFTDYADRREGWRQQRDAGDGSYEPYAACSFGAESVAALVECIAPLLDPGDLDIARVALLQTETLLGPRWAQLEPVLRRFQQELEELTSGPTGTELARVLATAAQLPEQKQLSFEVVLVARPRSSTSTAHHVGSHLVVEVSDDLPASRRVHVLFHEIAHLAERHAPGRSALRRAFAGHGSAGLVASNLWSEAFATAFGNGIAARAFDPAFTPDHSLYEDAAIDALGRALYLRWRDGLPVTLDASLAGQLIQLLDSAWPRERWRMSDLLSHIVLLGDDREAATLLRQLIPRRKLYMATPLPAELTLPDGFPPPVARIVLATLRTLRSRPDVLRLFGLDARAVRSQLSAHGASLYWQDADDGTRLLITAPARDELPEAARAFAALASPPPPGWTSLAPKKANPTH